ncbi:helix-turn-helix domain-containing protein [Paenibacillus sp.]
MIIGIVPIFASLVIAVTELAERVEITIANISILKTGKAKAIRLSTLDAICKALDCQTGDILEYKADEDEDTSEHS